MKTVMKTVMKSLIPLLVVASAVAAVDVQKRVLNGRNCTKDEGKHFVVLRSRTAPYDSFCGGNLISQDWVLTAAHCKDLVPEFDVALGYHATDTEQTREITKEDQKYIYKDGSVLHDIMLIKLPSKPSWKLDTIKLPTADQCDPLKFDFNAEYTLMGWSYTDVDQNNIKNQKKAVKLQCGEVKLDRSCQKEIFTNDGKGHRYKVNPALCSNEPMPCNSCSKKPCESCKGDSGGSLVKKSDGVLYGVTVGGPSKPTGLSWYLNVCGYIDWIRKTTGIKE